MNFPGPASAVVAALLAVPCLPESVRASDAAVPFEPILLADAGSVGGAVIGTPLAEPAGFSLRSFGVPSITNDGHVIVRATATSATEGRISGLLVGRAAGAGMHWTMPIRAGAPADAVGPGLVWRSFPRDPFLDYMDDASSAAAFFPDPATVPLRIGFYGRVAGTGVTSRTDDVLALLTAHPDGDREIVVLAREGGDAVGVPGAKFKSITAAAMAIRSEIIGLPARSQAVAFTAILETGPDGTAGPGGVLRSNDSGLWIWKDGVLSLALREGDVLDGRTVRSFAALRAPVGHGHAFTPDFQNYHDEASGGGYTCNVLISFTEGGRRLAVAGPLGTRKLFDEYTQAYWVDSGNIFGSWGRVQASSRNGNGQVVLLAPLAEPGSPSIPTILRETFDADAEILVRKGNSLEDGSILTALGLPISSRNGAFAFTGRTNTGVNGGWFGGGTRPLKEFFRIGADAPSAEGGKWRRLQSHAQPEACGALFTARLATSTLSTPAPGGVTTATDLGLWAVDQTGATRMLIREGQSLFGKTVRTFKTLMSATGSPAQTRSFNATGGVVVWVLATDYTQHLLQFRLQ